MSRSGGLGGGGSPGERWMSFLRGYGPGNRIDGMYAETIQKTARHYGFEPLRFLHPVEQKLAHALDPAAGRLTNVVLTGTAGDGKTTLCNELWRTLSDGDTSRVSGQNRENYNSLIVETPSGPKTVHFIFEFSGFAPEFGQQWTDAKLALLNRFAESVFSPDPDEFFVVAANDGKLVQQWDELPADAPAARLGPVFEDMLTSSKDALPDHRLWLLNLSKMPTKDILKTALDNLLARAEWKCFESEADDPAFGPDSPLYLNYKLLGTDRMRRKLDGLAELCDCNGLHVSIREALLLIVNAILGHEPSPEGLMTPATARDLAISGRAYESCLYDNLFGENINERRQENFAVFRYLNGFRIGHETSNVLDNLIVFGRDDTALAADYERLLAPDDLFGANPDFEILRTAYLEAEETRSDSSAFIKALVTERRRLFFRMADDDPRFDPWRLSVFEAAGAYRSQILGPLNRGDDIGFDVLSLLVQGLNRIWTGMLVGELDRLYLSTGLDFTTARLSDILLAEIPIHPGFHGSGVYVEFDKPTALPILRIAIDHDHFSVLPLHLVRFEFLTRVARGALPSSFSKECYEDVIAFKTKVLGNLYSLGHGRRNLSILAAGNDGALTNRPLGFSL